MMVERSSQEKYFLIFLHTLEFLRNFRRKEYPYFNEKELYEFGDRQSRRFPPNKTKVNVIQFFFSLQSYISLKYRQFFIVVVTVMPVTRIQMNDSKPTRIFKLVATHFSTLANH